MGTLTPPDILPTERQCCVWGVCSQYQPHKEMLISSTVSPILPPSLLISYRAGNEVNNLSGKRKQYYERKSVIFKKLEGLRVSARLRQKKSFPSRRRVGQTILASDKGTSSPVTLHLQGVCSWQTPLVPCHGLNVCVPSPQNRMWKS